MEELKRRIEESFPNNLDYAELHFECVVENLPIRCGEDILRLLPYVMKKSLSLAANGKHGELQVLEIAIRLFNGLSDCLSMQRSAIELQGIMNYQQRNCMRLWLLFLKDLGAIKYIGDDLDDCTKFWG